MISLEILRIGEGFTFQCISGWCDCGGLRGRGCWVTGLSSYGFGVGFFFWVMFLYGAGWCEGINF